MRTHKVGTVTLGTGLIVFGTLFIARVLTEAISYELVFGLWPILLIILGCEILVSHFLDKEGKMVYDKAAIFLIIVLTFFAMSMACAQFIFEHGERFYY